MTRSHIPGILAMALIVLASNILVQFLYGDWLTYGAFTYPLAFLVTDLMNRLYGAKAARQVVVVGFIVGVFCSLVGTQVLRTDFLAVFGIVADEPWPLVTLRVAIGSGVAFLMAQLLDVQIFDRMREGAWWRAPLVSTLVGATLDTAVFFFIAFSATLNGMEPVAIPDWAQGAVPLLGQGPEAPLWVSLAFADWIVKVSLALLALVPFRMIVMRATAKTV